MIKNTTIPSLLAAVFAATAHAQFPSMAPKPELPPLLTVQGRGEVRVENTVAVIQLGFEAASPEEAAVREDITNRSKEVTAMLAKDSNVERLETTAVNIRPQFLYDQGGPGKKPLPPEITGYTGQVAVSFQTPVDQAGKIISASMELGANSVSGMHTKPSDASRLNAEVKALTLAAQDAAAQADALIAALNLEKVGIRGVDAAGGRPGPMPVHRMMSAMADAAPSPELDIQGGETVVARTITMQVEFRSQ